MNILEQLQEVANLAQVSKWKRLQKRPLGYILAQLRRRLFPKGEWAVQADTFWGQKMQLLLPASLDIYLTGGKTHDSEIRLARWLIQELKAEDQFLDIGAHYGYFSLLAAHLVGPKGQVQAFEAASTTFRILAQNAAELPQLKPNNKAVAQKAASLKFYEFSNKHSEYNSLHLEQFEGEDWFAQDPPKVHDIEAVCLDDYLLLSAFRPKLIKIDVEGAEYEVLAGAKAFLSAYSPKIAMEYLAASRDNAPHLAAQSLLAELAYFPHIICSSGHLERLNSSVEDYLQRKGEDSDNIVFVKA